MLKKTKPRTGTCKPPFTDHIAFPLGGIGSGMVAVNGNGAFSHVSLRHQPDLFNEPQIFAAVSCKAPDAPRQVRLLQGPVPKWQVFDRPGAGTGLRDKLYGLPRFDHVSFRAKFPFAELDFTDDEFPLTAHLTAWSPFTPPDADDSSLPCAALEYTLANPASHAVDAVFSFHARNFMAFGNSQNHHTAPARNGFVVAQDAEPDAPHAQGAFAATLLGDTPVVNTCWFRGGWVDALTVLWRDIADGNLPASDAVATPPSAGGSLYLPATLAPGETRKITVLLSWHVPRSDFRAGDFEPGEPVEFYRPWHASRFATIGEVIDYWHANAAALRGKTEVFSNAFFDTTLPGKMLEAVAANLTILKSPTLLRQHDGRPWGWEGCADTWGSCHGTCTHVWNYAQALPHLFPALERSFRETEFNESQMPGGKQRFRANLPIGPVSADGQARNHAAADGQLGGIMKLHREWRACGSDPWLATLWPQAKASMEYCIRTWDPDEKGALFEPHHNTYDIEFWGADGMCTSFYIGALKAMALMAPAMNEDPARWQTLHLRARAYMEANLWNGEYFIQHVDYQNLRAQNPATAMSYGGAYSPEAVALMHAEGPKYQYGHGCLADGVLGAWLAGQCGVGEILDPEKTKSHLLSVFRYNFKKSLKRHANPQRPSYAIGDDGGLLLCTWPKSKPLTLPFPYSEEVWTGIEYHVAAHLLEFGCAGEALAIVEAARQRYDGATRNPFDEYECGDWYARAMSSFALPHAWAGIRFDPATETLHVAKHALKGRYFLANEKGFGTLSIGAKRIAFKSCHGTIRIKKVIRETCPR